MKKTRSKIIIKTSKVDDFTKTSIQDFGMSELTVKQISSRFQALGTSIGISSEQLVNSIEETENDGEKYAVFDFEAEKGILYTLVHNKIVINFLVKED